MQYHCSRCHEVFTAPAGKDGEGGEGGGHGGHGGGELHCPRCKAEAGLEPEHKAPRAMMLFAAFLAGAVVAATVGGVLSISAGVG